MESNYDNKSGVLALEKQSQLITRLWRTGRKMERKIAGKKHLQFGREFNIDKPDRVFTDETDGS